MQIATLCFSIVGAVTGTASLLVMLKTAHELKAAKNVIETKVASIEADVSKKKAIAKRAIAEMDL